MCQELKNYFEQFYKKAVVVFWFVLVLGWFVVFFFWLALGGLVG